MEKIKIKEIVRTKEWSKGDKSGTITTFKTESGIELQTFGKVEAGNEYEGTIEKNSNPAYTDTFKLKKTGGFGGGFKRDYTIEARMCALTVAANLFAAGKIKDSQAMVVSRDKFFDYIMGK